MSELRPLIRDVPPPQLPALLERLGQPRYRGRQLALWLHRAGAHEWDVMTDLPRDLRRDLAASFDVAALQPLVRLCGQDGTRKFLFGLRDGASIESVIIPMENHATFCLSSQVGCAMACRFCATARGGLVRNLSAGEIVEQVTRLAADLAAEPLPGFGGRGHNVVFMGMGEPLDNWAPVSAAIEALTGAAGAGISPRRITISTSGHKEGLQRLVRSSHGVGLTLSLNAVTPELRRRLMPVPARTPLPQLLDLAESYVQRLHRKVTLAYVLIAGVNDGLEEARKLGALVKRRPFKVNLIPLNRLEDDDLNAPDADRVLAFQQVLLAAGLQTYIRVSGGQDIAAACGQLRRRRTVDRPSDGTTSDRPGGSDQAP